MRLSAFVSLGTARFLPFKHSEHGKTRRPAGLRWTLPGLVLCAIFASNCGGSDSNPTAPTPQATPTRIINVSGNLAFGDVVVGSSKPATLTITNSGNSVLNVTGLNVTGGLGSHTNASWTNGQIGAGASQSVTVNFAPTAAGNYSGTVTVNADHTAGTNTISISGNALTNTPFAGVWTGTYIVEQCNGTGSAQDLFCSANRGLYPVGTSLPIRLTLSQNGSSVSGTVEFGQVTGPVTGVVSSGGTLTLQGTATNGQTSGAISSWSTRVAGNSMEGNFSYNATFVGLPGVSAVSARLGRMTR